MHIEAAYNYMCIFTYRFHVFARRFSASGAIATEWTWMGLFAADNIEVSNLEFRSLLKAVTSATLNFDLCKVHRVH